MDAPIKPRHVGHDWTPAEIETIKTMWQAGSSASVIAQSLGQNITRNAVIGKISRMKIDRHRSKPAQPGRPRAPAAKSKPIAAPRPIKIASQVATREGRAIVSAFRAAPRIDPDDGVDVTRLVGLVDLTSHSCRWPHGDPMLPGFGFCGKPIALGKTVNDGVPPYCEQHKRRAVNG